MQGGLETVDFLGQVPQASAPVADHPVHREGIEPVARALESGAAGRAHPPLERRDPGREGVLALDDQLRGGRRCRRAQVGDEIGDREIRLVPHRRDDRDGGGGDRPRDHLLVESPEVLHRAAAAADDEHVDVAPPGQLRDRRRDLRTRPLALDAHRVEEHPHVGEAPAEHGDDVADHRAGRAGHDADGARQRGQRPLARRVEKPLLLQLLLELLEGQLQRPLAPGFEFVDDELVLAPLGVEADPARGQRREPVARLEAEVLRRGAEKDRGDLPPVVLERKIGVARAVDLPVGDLALDPDARKRLLEQLARGAVEFRDRPDSACAARVRRHRSPRGHCGRICLCERHLTGTPRTRQSARQPQRRSVGQRLGAVRDFLDPPARPPLYSLPGKRPRKRRARGFGLVGLP